MFDHVDKQTIKSIENEVKMILNNREKDNKCDISCLMHKIDSLVFELYGLTQNEIATIASYNI